MTAENWNRHTREFPLAPHRGTLGARTPTLMHEKTVVSWISSGMGNGSSSTAQKKGGEKMGENRVCKRKWS